MVKKSVGRPPVMNVKTMMRLADLISHNYTIVDSCNYIRLSRSSYYNYLRNETLFRETMTQAKKNQNKVSFSFRTLY
jgi:hypothetical protein